MFQIGLPEFIIIALLVLIFVNPREFPGFMRKLGKLFAQLKEMRDGFKRSMGEFEAQIQAAGSAAPETAGEGRPTGSTGPVIHTTSGPVPVHRIFMRDVPDSSPVVMHLFIHSGIGDRVTFEAVMRHAVEGAGDTTRLIAIGYDPGDGYSIGSYGSLPHELWTLPQPAAEDRAELEGILASAVKTLGTTYYPAAASVTVIDYRQRPANPADPATEYRELYRFYSDTLVPLDIYPVFPLDQAVLRSVREELAVSAGEPGSHPLAALHLRRRKDMPEKNPRRADMLELARRLRALGFALVTFAEPGPPDHELESLVVYTCPLDPAFQHPACLLSLCSVFLGGDSGPAHLAAAVGTPVVSLRRQVERWVNGPFCPAERLIAVEGHVEGDADCQELVFDVDRAVAAAVLLTGHNAGPIL